jgi:hypothetical protein
LIFDQNFTWTIVVQRLDLPDEETIIDLSGLSAVRLDLAMKDGDVFQVPETFIRTLDPDILGLVMNMKVVDLAFTPCVVALV